MNSFSAKNKIFLVVGAWVIACGIMFGYVFGILDNANAAQVNKIAEIHKQLLQLQAEQKSYQQAQSDLDAVKTKIHQPGDLFSKDVTLVKEIKTLETLGQKASVQFQLSGLSGTVSTAAKAKANGQIFIIPISFNVTGAFENVVNFVQYLENLEFAVNINSLSVSVTTGSNVTVSLVGNLYISK